MNRFSCSAIAIAAILASVQPAAGQSRIEESGELRAGDSQLDSGEYYDRFDFEGRAGDRVDARLSSDDFDAFLLLLDDGDFSAGNDDEEGSATTNARIVETLPRDGSYHLVVTSYAGGETGRYDLQVDIGQGSRASAGSSAGSGNRMRGTLAEGDRQIESGEYLDGYAFEGRAGQSATISLTSSDFDTFLMVTSPGGEDWINDDAESGNTNSRLEIELPESGTYTILATSYEGGESGSYVLEASGVTLDDPLGSADDAGDRGIDNRSSLSVGSSVRGELSQGDAELDSGEYYDVYNFSAEPGTQVEFRLTSSDFDTYLAVIGSGDLELSNDDDASVGGTNSRLEVTVPADGQLTVAATSYAGGESGAYTLAAGLTGASARQDSNNGQSIALGQGVSGALAASDPRGATSVEDTYLLQAEAGQRVRLAVASDDFDTVLRVEGPGGFSTENDDEPSGNSLNSVVDTVLPSAGTYRVVVASYASDGMGSYRLETSGSSAGSGTPGRAGSLAAGGQISGTLASGDETIPSGEYYDVYQFEGQRGQRVSIDMSSSEFDTYLSLLFPGGGQEENDDRAGGEGTTNSRLDVTLPEDGTYSLVATSYQAGETGSYAISMASQSNVATTIDPNRGSSRVFVLSVGVADYGGRAGNLSLTDQDAMKLTQTMQASGMLAPQSVTLVNAQATRANFIAAIEDIGANIGPDDLFLLFFSGHGSKTPVEAFMERDGTSETIEMYDAPITDYELTQMIDPIRARTLLVLDSCFSGGFDNVINSRVGRMGVFSSDSDLTSLVASKFEAGGYISHILQQAMEGRADANADHAITAGELSEYMRTTFYRIALSEPLQTTAIGSGGSRAQGYQHVVVNRGGDGMPYDEVLLNLTGGISAAPVEHTPALARLGD